MSALSLTGLSELLKTKQKENKTKLEGNVLEKYEERWREEMGIVMIVFHQIPG